VVSSSPAQTSRLHVVVLVVATLACLLPFVNKAIHIDDPVYIWIAQRILNHPADFYGFSVNWYGTEQPVSGMIHNPPLASFYLAAVGGLFGWDERVLHLAFLIPTIGTILGVYFLARRLCQRPLLAAIVTLVAPGFLVSATTLMYDVPQLCLWVWAILAWDVGLRDRRVGWLFLGAALAGLAALTKYIGVALVPLLLAYAIAWRGLEGGRRKAEGGIRTTTPRLGFSAFLSAFRLPPSAFLALSIPVLMLAGYNWYTRYLYGSSELIQAAGHSAGRGLESFSPMRMLVSLDFVGGGALSAVCLLPWAWTRKLWWGPLVLALAIGVSWLLSIDSREYLLHTGESVRWSLLAQGAVLSVAGGMLLTLTVQDLLSRRDASAVLLTLWVFGTFLFLAMVNWTVNIRSMLPMIPALAIITIRRMDSLEAFGVENPKPDSTSFDAERRTPNAELFPFLALVPVAALSLLVAWADLWWANNERDVARDLIAVHASESKGQLWFQGHWGFQYYMQAAGARPFDYSETVPAPGDWIIEPNYNTNVQPLLPYFLIRNRYLSRDSFPHVAITGFYLSQMGATPFQVGTAASHRYRVIVVPPAAVTQSRK
jgi:Dolichyl-phosphate-mannose-protein mannosyltransferase